MAASPSDMETSSESSKAIGELHSLLLLSHPGGTGGLGMRTTSKEWALLLVGFETGDKRSWGCSRLWNKR